MVSVVIQHTACICHCMKISKKISLYFQVWLLKMWLSTIYWKQLNFYISRFLGLFKCLFWTFCGTNGRGKKSLTKIYIYTELSLLINVLCPREMDKDKTLNICASWSFDSGFGCIFSSFSSSTSLSLWLKISNLLWQHTGEFPKHVSSDKAQRAFVYLTCVTFFRQTLSATRVPGPLLLKEKCQPRSLPPAILSNIHKCCRQDCLTWV